jgi:tetratricopeptide (TPR) repeat protein
MIGREMNLEGKDSAGLHRRALEDFDALLALNPKDGEAQHGRGKCYLGLGCLEDRQRKDSRNSYARAIEAFDEALRLLENHAASLNERGYALHRLGMAETRRYLDARERFRRAIRDFERTLEIVPKSVGVHYRCANAWRSLGDAQAEFGDDAEPSYEKALEEYAEELRRTPRFWRALGDSGLVLERLGRYAEAAKAFADALGIVKDGFPPLKRWRGRAADHAKASPWLRKLIHARQWFSSGAFSRAETLFEAGLREAEEAGAGGNDGSNPVLANACCMLACVHAQAAIGKNARLAEPVAVAPGEAASRRSRAIASLRRALEFGWKDIDRLRKDKELQPLRGFPEFTTLLKEWEEKLAKEEQKGG